MGYQCSDPTRVHCQRPRLPGDPLQDEGGRPLDERVETLRTFMKRLLRGDLSAALALAHEDIRYRVPGSNLLSGHFHGKDEVARHLQDYRRFTNDASDIVKWEDWLVGLEYVAAVTALHLQQPTSRLTSRTVCLAAFSEEGLIKELEVFFRDERAIERFVAGRET